MSAPSAPVLAAPSEVAEIAALASAGGRLGIDTEFMSEGRYHTLLCLVQVVADDPSHPDGIRIALLDPLDGRLDPAPLAEVLADPQIEIVMHAGRHDVALLRRVWRTEVRNIFDTQIAGGFAGFGAQTGYGNMLSGALGQHVGKTASYTRWETRPLSEEQLSYAREDVLHLLRLSDALHERLQATGRLQWAREECRRLQDASERRDTQTIFERLPRSNALDGHARAIARELVEWRERLAEELDKPVGSIIPDASLVEIAKRKPDSPSELAQIRGLHAGHLRKRGAELIAAVRRGTSAEPIPREPRRPSSEPADVPVISLIEAMIRTRLLSAGLAYELITSRSELEQIVIAARRGHPEPDVRPLRGWRRELVGAELVQLLAGELALWVRDGAVQTGPAEA